MVRVRLREYRVSLARLGSEFEGYRILQLTDLHFGRRTHGKEAIELAKSAGADLIVLTGDIVHRPRWANLAERFFGRLTDSVSVPDGFLAVLGNHDVDLNGLVDRNLPIRWLRNETVQIERGAGGINIVGLDQRDWVENDVPAAAEGIVTDYPTIVLGHYPATATIVNHMADLVIAGHTHAGQVRLPALPFFANDRLGWRYGHGLRTLRDTQLIVCAGLGYSGPISLRLFAQPEVAVITLTGSRRD